MKPHASRAQMVQNGLFNRVPIWCPVCDRCIPSFAGLPVILDDKTQIIAFAHPGCCTPAGVVPSPFPFENVPAIPPEAPVRAMNRLKIGIRLVPGSAPAACPAGGSAPGRRRRPGGRGRRPGPADLSQTGRREFRHLLRSYNLELTALGCPLRRGLDAAENQQAAPRHVRQSHDPELRPRAARGRRPGRPRPRGRRRPRRPAVAEALRDLGRYGDRIGAGLALETGLEWARAGRFLDFDTGGLGGQLDPANLLLDGFDPYDGARALAGRSSTATPRTPAGRSRQPGPPRRCRWARRPRLANTWGVWKKSTTGAG